MSEHSTAASIKDDTASATDSQTAGKTPARPGACRVLLAEDDAANILVATTMMEMWGYDFHVVSSGPEAVERAKTGFYSIILMDLKMPVIDGFEATRLIRAFESNTPHPPIQIMCLTASALVGERERCLAAGMDDYLAKPFGFDEFEQKLANLRQKAELGRDGSTLQSV